MAIVGSALPVFTGLGHEIDRSVADDVAHTALKTPTACAAALVEHVGRFRQRVDDTARQLQQAAEIGLYGWEFLMNSFGDPTGLTLPVCIEEIFWGDAGIGMAIMGSALAAAGISGNGTPEQVMEWVVSVL